MAAGDALRVIRNAPYRFHFGLLTTSTGQILSGDAANLTASISLASGAIAAVTPGTETEIGSTGIYYIDLTAAEMTAAGAIFIHVVSATGTVTEVLKEIMPEPALDSGVAQAGASQTITLRSAASATTDLYVGAVIEIVTGTGTGQARTIVYYDGSTKVATVDRAWVTNPASGSVYLIHPRMGADVPSWISRGLAQSGGATSIRLATTASATDYIYNGMTVQVVAGAGAGQIRTITDYVGSSTTATIDRAWATNPDGTSIYIVRPVQGFVTQTAGIPDVNVEYIDNNATAAANLEQLTKGGQVNGTVNDAAATTLDFDGDSSLSSTNDFYLDCFILFVTGTLAGISRQISNYVGATRNITVATALPSAPANGVEFVIIGNAT